MTTKNDQKITCSNCNKSSKQIIIVTTNELGASDLDTRPAEMRRSTLQYWIQTCPYCGYCSTDLNDIQENISQIINSYTYKIKLNNKYNPSLANAFSCSALINQINKNYSESAWAFIYAAWVCDDFKDESNAIFFRKKAIDLIDLLEKENKFLTKNEESHILIKIDLLRRATLFNQALKQIETDSTKIKNEKALKILNYEKKLIIDFDIGCYSIRDVFEKVYKYINVEPNAKQKKYIPQKEVKYMNTIMNDILSNLFKELNKLSSLPTTENELPLNDYREIIDGIEKILKMIRIALDIEKKEELKEIVKNNRIDIPFEEDSVQF
ncbi:MAG: DUF2225 domain-containing protein [Melioribacteraceae bacterium]